VNPLAQCLINGTPSEKRFATTQAEFARLGRELVRHVRAGDGRVSYVVSRAGDAWHFTHWHHVAAHLSAIR
jgi:quinol monooxygenase YgiN